MSRRIVTKRTLDNRNRLDNNLRLDKNKRQLPASVPLFRVYRREE